MYLVSLFHQCFVLFRYIPVGILEHLPQRINERPPPFVGRNDLETLMGSKNCSDWIKIRWINCILYTCTANNCFLFNNMYMYIKSEMLLGPVPANFQFLPKHKASSYSTS